MRSIFTLLLFCLSLPALAQKEEPKNIYFLTNKGRYVEVLDSADYIRIVKTPDSGSVLYNVTEFYKSGKPKLIGKSSKIDPLRYDGQTVGFYESGRRQSTFNYKQGQLSGDAFEYYPNGRLYREINYPETNIRDTSFKVSYKILANLDSTGKVLVDEGNGYYRGFDEKFKYINEEGQVKAGLRDSTWKGRDINLKLTFEEHYHNGKIIEGSATDSTGARFAYYGVRQTMPKFPKGDAGFGRYLGLNIIYPNYERANNIQGTVILAFVVEKDGTLSDIKVNKPVSKGLDEEAIRVLKRSPRWTPGTMYGKPIRVSYTVPLTFSLQN